MSWQVDCGPVTLGIVSTHLISTSIGDRAEGAENKTSDKANHSRGLSSSSGDGGKSQSSTPPEGQALVSRMKQLSLQCAKGRDGIVADIKMVQIG